MSKDLERLLVDPRKEIHRAKGTLAKLFRRILWDLDIKPDTMNALMLRHLNDPANAIPNNGKVRSTERGNIIKDLSKTEMTWRNFEKGLRLLHPIRAKFRVEMEWRDGVRSIHEVKLFDNDENTGDKS